MDNLRPETENIPLQSWDFSEVKTEIKVLIIDDSESDRTTYARYLQLDSENTYNIIESEMLEEGLEMWRSGQPDIVLIDLNLPDGDGLEFLEEINVDNARNRVPVIMLTGQGNEKMAVNAMKLGAADYLVKGDITAKSLATTVKQVLRETVLSQQLRRSQQQQLLISEIALRIREFLNLEDISNAIVKEVRQFIKADRAAIYQFTPDMSGAIVAEDVVSPWLPCLNMQVEDTCFRENLGGAYCEGMFFVANDIYAANLTDCHIKLLERFQVRANLVVPILLPNVEQQTTLWGLLILHQCSAPRNWQELDIQLLQLLSVQLAIGIKQAIAYQQVQTELAERRRVELLLLEQQLELEERNHLLELTSADLECSVEELRVTTEDLIAQHRQLEYEQIRYQNLFNFAPDGYLVTDITGRIGEANQAILDLLAIIHEAILRKPFASFIDSDHLELFYNQLNSLVSQNKLEATWEITITPRQGQPFPAEIIVAKNINSDTNNAQLLWIVRDISDRKRAEQTLQQLNQSLETKVAERTQELGQVNQLLQTVLDAFPLSVFWKDRQSVILGCNQLFATNCGMNSPLEAVGKTNFECSYPKDEALDYLADDREVMESGLAKLNIEKTITLASGEQQWIQINKIPLRDSEGKVIGVVGTSQDISDRKQSETQLKLANQELLRATKLKDEFLANMSHELRTPLNSILGLSESLQEEILGSLNETQLKAIATVEASGEHLLSLINDVLDLSKISAGMIELDIESASVANLCSSSLVFIKQQAFNKRIQIHSYIPSLIDNININIDERRIKQVLINLLTNAVKFTPNEGRITLLLAVGSGHAWQGEATIPQRLRDMNSPMIVFQIIDTGIGIASNDLQRLFQPFVQIDSALNRQYEGTGLGLALVKQIVELHGGQVTAESEVGKGSCFTFALPYVPSQPIASESKLTSTDLQDSLSRDVQPENAIAPLILLAEDNEANIQTFTSYLNAINYRVIVAKNGEEAVAMAKANSPDIILMDIQMPIMDGLEAIGQIRSDTKFASVPIIALTALAMEGDRERCLAAGANEYLSKPIKLKQLATVIQQLLSSL